MSETNTPSKKAEVVYSRRMVHRAARAIIEGAIKKGASSVSHLLAPLSFDPEFDGLVAREIRAYKAHSGRKFNL